MGTLLFNYFIFPGFLFLSVSGMLASWVDRKVTARLQWRVGPPLLQPYYDLRKLFSKETIIPEGGNRLVFVLSPIVAVVSAVLLSDLLLVTWIDPSKGFLGDIIVVLYLFMLIPVSVILGASASHNPMASLGASREMKLVLSYEFPFIVSLLVVVLKTRTILLGNIMALQRASGPVAGSLSGFLALCVALFCLQGKTGLAPFDLSEAETEISGGSLIEYSGPLLAFWKLSKMMLLVVGPLFLVLIFWGGGSAPLMILKYAVFLIISVLIRNTNPRIKIDQAMRWFWGPVSIVSIIALLLALGGR